MKFDQTNLKALLIVEQVEVREKGNKLFIPNSGKDIANLPLVKVTESNKDIEDIKQGDILLVSREGLLNKTSITGKKLFFLNPGHIITRVILEDNEVTVTPEELSVEKEITIKKKVF